MLILPVFVQNIQKVSSQVFLIRLAPPPPVDWQRVTILQCDFQISSLAGIYQGTFEPSLRKSNGPYEDLIKQYEVSHMLQAILEPDHMQ